MQDIFSSSRESELKKFSESMRWSYTPGKIKLKNQLYSYRYFKLKYIEYEENVIEGILNKYKFRFSDLSVIDGVGFYGAEYKLSAVVVTPYEGEFARFNYNFLNQVPPVKLSSNELEVIANSFPNIGIESIGTSLIFYGRDSVFNIEDIVYMITCLLTLIEALA